MVTILFSLLMIQMAIQLTMASVLEGRTSHYVRLLDSPVTDDSAKRITCSVFSIRLAYYASKYTKYTASEAQFNEIQSDWIVVPDIASFKDCAYIAYPNMAKMFMWENGECSLTRKLFRRLSEPCNDETSTLVYMIEPPESTCEGDLLILSDGDTADQFICNGAPTMTIVCLNGKIYGIDSTNTAVYHDDGIGCITFKSNSGNPGHDVQQLACGSDATCYPDNESERAEYVQILKKLAFVLSQTITLNSNTLTTINLKYDESGDWKWNSDVVHPSDEGWISNPDFSSSSSFPYGYMNTDGLTNGGNSGSATFVCCYKTH